jgi:hypothetical protein
MRRLALPLSSALCITKELVVSIKERAIRVLFSIVFLGVALFYLNHSAYSFWLSSGPPNDYPKVWYNQGIISGWYAIVLICAGIFFQFRWAKLKSSRFAKFIAVALLCGLAYSHSRQYFLIDTCLDFGGAWDYEHFECKH